MTPAMVSAERKGFAMSGGVALFLELLAGAAAIALLLLGIGAGNGAMMVVGALLAVATLVAVRGLFIVQPNQAVVIVLFGRYVGTVREGGWYWTNPFATRQTVSLRVNNFQSPVIKVNDLDGNPIEIGAVVVWRVVDTARASFDVSDYSQFVKVQSETAIRHLASKYAYDSHGEEKSLRGSADSVASDLRDELASRLANAGVDVVEARLSHLAYSPEIAGAMLQRQQATAILAARQRIVEGAVGIVEDVLTKLHAKGIVQMTPSEQAEMVRSLLIVIASERGAQPVLTTT